MNVTIEDSCIGCGACESICDAVFSVEDKAKVNAGAVAGNEASVKEAADACPVSAIVAEQNYTKQKRHLNYQIKVPLFISDFYKKKSLCYYIHGQHGEVAESA